VVAAVTHLIASRPPAHHTDNVPHPMMLEYDISDNPLREGLTHDPIRPRPGGIAVPTGPGLGLSFIPAAIDALRAA